MGEVRARVADRVRVLRSGGSAVRDEDAERLEETRRRAGVVRVPGVLGDVVLGRHAWKEYVQGLHEGWLGPLEAPIDSAAVIPDEAAAAAAATDDAAFTKDDAVPAEDAGAKPAVKAAGATPPYISPASYASAPLPAACPRSLDPIGVVPFPHILGFLNTPVRLYRFVTRRHLADACGREAAAVALACSRRFRAREIEGALSSEEGDWPARYWSDEALRGEWQEDVVADERVGGRMRRFVLEEEAQGEGEEVE